MVSYSPFDFAGNPLMISLTGWSRTAGSPMTGTPAVGPAVDYPAARFEDGALKIVERWRSCAGRCRRLRSWCDLHRDWLDDYALFTAIKEAHNGATWTAWDAGLAHRRAEDLAAARKQLAGSIERHALQQYWFWSQWKGVRRRATDLGLRLVGDLPIYVSEDSADLWARPDLFQLDPQSRPLVVAGVPPDYFSETGQLWANPIYHWERHREEGYAWWRRRVRHLAEQVDFVRLDHFRGLESYWEVPVGSATAASGRWVIGPGASLLAALRADLGRLPLIAEDLGVITPEVKLLRDSFDLPGMKILQFDLEGWESDGDLPEKYPERCVAYTGTHDNDTSRGWYEAVSEETRDFARRVLGTDGTDIAWSMIRAIWASGAGWSLAPIQDFLSLGGEARMNYPGRAEGNWRWRLTTGAVDGNLADRVMELNHQHRRDAAAPA
jgi:4-alpha-glucanotransferase